uniref:Uncharacterized protein n=1 Tax=Brassica oleracea var. oleracea TaxID=109376 RepID=A0A0D3CQQ8_BRAOL
MEIVEFDMASPFFFLSRMIGSLHVFTNVSDGYESSSDQESYSETSSCKLSKRFEQISCLRERERKVSDAYAYRLLLESKDFLFSMMIMVVSFSKVSFFLSSLKLNQSARLTLRLEYRPFVVRCEASSNGREEARYEVVLV